MEKLEQLARVKISISLKRGEIFLTQSREEDVPPGIEPHAHLNKITRELYTNVSNIINEYAHVNEVEKQLQDKMLEHNVIPPCPVCQGQMRLSKNQKYYNCLNQKLTQINGKWVNQGCSGSIKI